MDGAEIPAGTTIKGEIDARGDLLVSGRIEGSVRVAGALRIAAGGSVVAQVHAARAVIAGAVKGDVVAAESIQLLAGCSVDGELHAPSIQIEGGAALRGRVEVGASDDEVAPEPRRDGPPPMPASALALGERRKRIVVPPPLD